MICHLCCILNKILKFETSTSLHSVFIHNLYSVPTFLESGLYFSQQKTWHFSPSYGYKQVLKTLELRQKQNAEGNVGLVRLPENPSQVIPAGQSAFVCGTASIVGPHFDKWVVVEHPSLSSLPCGLIVKTCMATPGNKRHCHLPVVVINTTAHGTTIPPRCVMAELKAVQSVHSDGCYDHESKTETIPKSILKFNFGDSPIPPESINQSINQ